LEGVTPRGAPEDEIIRAAEEQDISAEKTKAILLKMKEWGDVFCPKLRYYKLVS
jgi:DNA replicative helicase MCM subunit Mcm2 (Cdc46/Mcm family)